MHSSWFAPDQTENTINTTSKCSYQISNSIFCLLNVAAEGVTGSTCHSAGCVGACVFLLVHNVIMSWLFVPALCKTTEALSLNSGPPHPQYMSHNQPLNLSTSSPHLSNNPDLLAPKVLKAHSEATKPSFVLSTMAGAGIRTPQLSEWSNVMLGRWHWRWCRGGREGKLSLSLFLLTECKVSWFYQAQRFIQAIHCCVYGTRQLSCSNVLLPHNSNNILSLWGSSSSA